MKSTSPSLIQISEESSCQPLHSHSVYYCITIVYLLSTYIAIMWCRAIVRPPTIQRATNRAALSTFRTHQNPRGRRTPSQPIRRTPSSPSSSSSSPQPQPQPQSQSQPHNPEPQETSRPNPDYNPAQNTLLSPVHVPEDPNGALRGDHPATNILANSGLVVQRQLEMMNVMMYVSGSAKCGK